MRKLISFVLTLLILTSILPYSVSAAQPVFSDTLGGEYYYTAATELSSRGIITGYPDGSFGAERTITRAEMATVICRMTGRDLVAKINPGNSYYTDVADSHWAKAYINLATDDKIINGDGNGLFRPEDSVNYQEAVKLVVCAAGYGRNIEINENDWSLGYISMANEKGLTKNLIGKKGEALSRGDVAVLVYNTVKLMDEEAEKRNENNEKLAELNEDEDPGIQYKKTGQVASYVGNFYDGKVAGGEDAKASLELLKDYIGIEDIDTELEYVDSYESGDFIIYIMNQIYKGITVYGHEIRVKTDKEGNPVSMASGFLLMDSVNTKPSIIKNDAINIVKAEHPEAAVNSETELVIYANTDEEPYLAYMIEIAMNNSDEKYCAVVDAHSGEIRDFYMISSTAANDDTRFMGEDVNGYTVGVGAVKTPTGYALSDNERKIYTRTSKYDPTSSSKAYEFSKAIYDPKYDEDADKNGYKDFQLALTAHSNATETFEYYRNVHKHTYINNNAKNPTRLEVVVPSYNEDGTPYKNNAYARKGYMDSKNLGIIGFGTAEGTFAAGKNTYNYNYAVSMDAVAHEFTHLIFYTKAKAVSEKYRGFNGAINEAYADIMGLFAEAYSLGNNYCDWKMFAEVSNGKYRDLSNPNSMEYPSKLGGDFFLNPVSDTDKGGVHQNSTVIGHAAYLMSDKIKHNRLEKLWYASMDNYTGLSDFTHVRVAVLQAADELHFSDEEKAVIAEAFDNVGIEEQTPYVTFYVVENNTDTVLKNVTLEFKRLKIFSSEGPEPFSEKTDASGKVTVKLSKLPHPLKIVASKKGYQTKKLSYGIENKFQERVVVISLFQNGVEEQENNGKGVDADAPTNVVTIYDGETPLYSISNVKKHEKNEENWDGIIVENCTFECEGPVTITVIEGGGWFEIMDWTPSMQTGQSMDVGFIMPDNCPSAEEYRGTEGYQWDVKAGTTFTLDQPGYYNIGASGPIPDFEEEVEEYEGKHFSGIVKIIGQRTAEPHKYTELKNSYLYDEALYNNLFKYGTEVPVEARDGYYILGEDCDLYKIYPDNGALQDTVISFEPLSENAEFDASYSVLKDRNWRNLPYPATISYGTQTLKNGEMGFLNMHIGNVKIKADGIKVVGVKTDGTVIPAGREIMLEVERDIEIVAESGGLCSYEVYDEYYEYDDGSSYKNLAFSGSDLSNPITVRAGQKVKIKTENSDVKILHPKYALYITAYMSR